jgi:hypothetical protein
MYKDKPKLIDYDYLLKKDEWDINDVIQLLTPTDSGKFEKLIEASINAKNLIPLRLYYVSGGLGGNYKYLEAYFDPLVITEWAIKKELPIPTVLLDWHEEQRKKQPKELTVKNDLDLPHFSKDLKILIEASNRFWGGANPEDKATHDPNEKIETWLVGKGFSGISAKQGAVIIRPEWAAKGRPTVK